MTVVPLELLTSIADEAPAPVQAAGSGNHYHNGNGNGNGHGAGSNRRLMIDKWLTDRGIAFRVKDRPDGRGRTVYVLKVCPFDASHRDPDSCVMQEPSGKLSAQCFHDSCRGRGWSEFKEKIGAPNAEHFDPPFQPKSPKRKPPNRKPAQSDDLPVIICGCENPSEGLKVWTPRALEALKKYNVPARLFAKGNALVRLTSIDSTTVVTVLSADALRGELDRAACWGIEKVTKVGVRIDYGPAPSVVVRDLLALPSWDPAAFPPLDLVVESPRFLPDGRLLTEPGYHAEQRLYYLPQPEIGDLHLPDQVSDADVAAAKSLIFGELLHDFPFDCRASKAHALAGMVLPFVRLLIRGPTPFHMFEAPTEGSGKGLLAGVCALPAIGGPLESVPQKEDNAEWRKALTSALLSGRSHVYIDNMYTPMDWKRETYRVWAGLKLQRTGLDSRTRTVLWQLRSMANPEETEATPEFVANGEAF
jgi:hypothetical protein